MPVSCHFRDCKALLVTSLTHVSGAIASVQTYLYLYLYTPYSSVSLGMILSDLVKYSMIRGIARALCDS